MRKVSYESKFGVVVVVDGVYARIQANGSTKTIIHKPIHAHITPRSFKKAQQSDLSALKDSKRKSDREGTGNKKCRSLMIRIHQTPNNKRKVGIKHFFVVR